MVASTCFCTNQPLWVWILIKTWCALLRRLYPVVISLDGFCDSLPPVDVLLLSHVTLTQCSIKLPSCPASLIISTSRLRASPGWSHRFWRFQHSHVGGATTGSFRLYSLHRFPFIVPPLFINADHLPAGDIYRILSATTTGGRHVDAPRDSSYLQSLFDLQSSAVYFIVPSVVMSSGWCRRRLSLAEVFQLLDFSLVLFYKLNTHQWVRLIAWNGIPARVLGFCLRHFLACQNLAGGGGGGKGI